MRERRRPTLFTRLTTVKLSLQLLQRRVDRDQDPEGLLDLALRATDSIIGELCDDGVPPVRRRAQPLPESPGAPLR